MSTVHVIVNCNSLVKSIWQVCSIQRQVAFFFPDNNQPEPVDYKKKYKAIKKKLKLLLYVSFEWGNIIVGRGVGRSRRLGGWARSGRSLCATDIQKISVYNVIKGVQGAEPPGALEILSKW